MTRIGLFLFEDVEELDFAGPWEVLSFWARHLADDVEVLTFARENGPVTCAKGLRVIPDLRWDGAPPELEVVVVPGGQGTRPLVGDAAVREALRGWHSGGALVTSVCTGALLLADAGLLDGRRATTHWASLERLADMGVEAVDERWVDVGDVITASGVSAGIDMALHLVARLAGERVAGQVRRGIQYDPAPPVENVELSRG